MNDLSRCRVFVHDSRLDSALNIRLFFVYDKNCVEAPSK
jgi:hypothetical protein